MPKDDFTDLLSFGNEDENAIPEDEGTLATVIKNDELSLDDGEALVTDQKVIESEIFKLRLFKKENVIDSIEIECRCGKSAVVQLEYEQPEEDEAVFETGDDIEDTATAPAEEMPPSGSEESGPL